MEENKVTPKNGSRVTQIIDAHVHFVPGAYRKALEDAGQLMADGFPIPQWNAQMHLEAMDRKNIAASILGLSSPGFHFGDNAKGRALAREINEVAGTARRDHPARFGFFASLPLPDVDGSLTEIEYAFDVLHADGVTIHSNNAGVYLGDPQLEPVFAELGRRNAVITIHPTKPSAVPANVLSGIPIPMFEFMFDTSRAVANLIFSGTLERYPGIKLIVPHSGGILPVLAARMDGVVQLMAQLKIREGFTPPDVLGALRNLYYDLAGFAVPVQLSALLQIASPDRILYGSDYPFTPELVVSGLADKLQFTDLFTEEQRTAVFRQNALSLFPRFK